ncbi:XrtA/PEP-CTERM system histidine kinase PrsK [Thalassomonas sp. M1454]|uniref:XrtA/PEP-CTERM system histidine kinase PrsK n=1 Tax=Thalassomonas sp. M1454 TaxID=2594477 RepID=UPI00117F8867|nr:XrtA/PEP-CTERM system histidine kinase PrsK [Thalassomonas sp. M1454]TRX57956.1 PEP-CTERM system histidine kinase PrsK [Thalassomonas sp. M1454]
METFGLLGYGIAAVAYLFFLLLLLVAKQKLFASQLMVFSCFITFVACSISAAQLYYSFPLQISIVFEALKTISWSALLISLNCGAGSFSQLIKSSEVKKYLFICLVCVILTVSSVLFFAQYTGLFIALLALNLWALVLLEQLYRNHKSQLKWAIWPLLSGLGMIFIFDFIMFAQGALLTRLDFDFWYVRGFIILLALPFIVLSSKRLKDVSPDLFISRDVIFYSSMLVLSGVYLLLLALSGYVIRFIGGQWSDMFSIFFMVFGGVVLFTLLITTTFRNKIKVFITKHFFANRYDYRVEWLRLISEIESANSANEFANACKAMANSLAVNYCGFVAIKNNILTIKHQGELNLTDEVLQQLKLIDNYCQVNHWIIDVRELHATPGSYQGLDIDSAYLIDNHIEVIIPTYHQQQLLGYFVLPGPKDSPTLNWENRDYLFAVSKQLGSYLSLHQAQATLAQNQQFLAFHQMSSFVLHDLKNIQSQLVLLCKNAQQHKHNPEFVDDAFSTIAAATDRLDKVVSQLRVKAKDQQDASLHSTKIKAVKVESVNVCELLNNVLAVCNQKTPEVSVSCTDDLFLTIDKEQLTNVLIHLIENAQEACGNGGDVSVVVTKIEAYILIEISDTGCGMDQEFIATQLFQPFRTTKGNSGMGIGVFEAKQFVEEHDGVIKVSSEVGKGSTFTVQLPIADEQLKEVE